MSDVPLFWGGETASLRLLAGVGMCRTWRFNEMACLLRSCELKLIV
jgi:hypothetical protein